MNTTANISALGYAAFAVTLWLSSMGPAGWFAPGTGDALLQPLLVVLGGGALALAGIFQGLRGNSLDSTLFLVFAAYWCVAGLAVRVTLAGGLVSPGWLGWYHIAWTIVALGIWLAACRDGVARMLFTLGLWLSLFAHALAGWTGIDALTVLGGYLGLVAAIVGIYIAAAELVNEVHGDVVLPMGQSADAARTLARRTPVDH